MVNNAGMEVKQPFLETPLGVWQRVISVNLTGVWLGCQEAARRMVSQGEGGRRIINVSSVHEDLPMPTNAPYCTAKGGVRMLMRTAAVERAPHNVTPGAVAPPRNRETLGTRTSRTSCSRGYRWSAWPSRKRWADWPPTSPPTPPRT